MSASATALSDEHAARAPVAAPSPSAVAAPSPTPSLPTSPPASPRASTVISWASLEPDAAKPPLPGGMGVVFRATWSPHGGVRVEVGVKVLKGGELDADAFAAAAAGLEAEAGALATASYDGLNERVVSLFGVARGRPTAAWRAKLGVFAHAVLGAAGDRDLVGLVMRWEAGGSLAHKLHGGAVPWVATTAEKLLLLERIAEGVALLHATTPLAIIHGDIKSENVLLSEVGLPRLADFGLAALKKAATTGGGASTAAGTAASGRGTWPYMAPEMFKDGDTLALEASRVTDVYALATLCWEVLAVRRPWADHTEGSRLFALYKGRGLDWSALPANVPVELRAALARATDSGREARPRAGELCDALAAARRVLEAGAFDVFLSHAWAGSAHAPLTTLVRRVLRDDAHAHVWVDEAEMGLRTGDSMRAGVAASAIVVALVSRLYASRPNCMLELREAARLGKTIIPANVDADAAWWPRTDAASDSERELAALVVADKTLMVDLRAAAGAAVDWSDADAARGGAAAFLGKPEALPRLLVHVREALGRGAATVGGGADAESVRSDPRLLPRAAPSAGSAASDVAGGPVAGGSAVGDVVSREHVAANLERGLSAVEAGKNDAFAIVAVLHGVDGESSAVCVAACDALAKLSHTDTSMFYSENARRRREAAAASVIASGAPAALVTVLRTHMRDVVLCASACRALRQIASSSSRGRGFVLEWPGTAAAIACGAPAAIVAVLGAHPIDITVCAYACGALGTFAFSDAGNVSVVASGAPDALKTALGSSDSSLCASACKALGRIAGHSAGRAAVLESRALTTLVDALGVHAQNIAVCAAACHVLEAIAHGDAGTVAIITCGAVAAVVSAMGAHLHNISPPDSSPFLLYPDVEIDGEPIISGFQCRLNMRTDGCKFLRNITRRSEGRAAAIACGATFELVSAISTLARLAATDATDICLITFSQDCLPACNALQSIVSSDAGASAAIKYGAPVALVYALSACDKYDKLIERTKWHHEIERELAASSELACSTLRTLRTITSSDVGRAAALAADCIPAITAAVRRHAAAREDGCAVLKALGAPVPTGCIVT